MKQKLFFLTFALLATQTFVQASEEDGCVGRAGGGGRLETACMAAADAAGLEIKTDAPKKTHKIHGRSESRERKVIDPTLRTGYLWNPRPEDLFAELIDSVHPDTALDTGYSKESKDAAAQRLVNGIKQARTPKQRYSFIKWIIDNAQEAKDAQLYEALEDNTDWQEIVAAYLKKPIIESTQASLAARNTHASVVSTEFAKLAALQEDHKTKFRTHKEETDTVIDQERANHQERIQQARKEFKEEIERARKRFGIKVATSRTDFLERKHALHSGHKTYRSELTTILTTAQSVASILIKEAQERAEAAIARTAAHHPIAALLTGVAVELGAKLSKELTDTLAQRDELLVEKQAPVATQTTDEEWTEFIEAPHVAVPAPTVPTTPETTTTPAPTRAVSPSRDEAPETDDEAETDTDDALEHKGHIKPTSNADREKQRLIVRRLIQQQVDKARSTQERSE